MIGSRGQHIIFSVLVLSAGLTAVVVAAMAIPLASATIIQERTAIPKAPDNRSAGDPTSLPRLTFERLQYAGAFRLPAEETGGDSFSFGGHPIAFNPDNRSLFAGTRSGKVAEVSIPVAVKGATVEALPFATYLQPFADPAEGHIKDIAGDGANLAGLLVYDRRLIGTGVIYYDAVNQQSLSHFARPLMLNERAVNTVVRVGQSGKTGFVAGYMANVPAEWQSRLGGPVVTGQCCIPIISRTSWGPAAFVFDPAAVNAGRNTSAEPLVYYDSEHPALGAWEGANGTFGATAEVAGVALIAGTRTALFVGRNGTGTFCYGDGTADQSRHDSRGPNGEHYCFDPVVGDKGPHAYPYRFQMWAYDLGELAEVRAGHRDPWSVKPYAVWPFELPLADAAMRVGGVAYDAARQQLFIVQMRADRDGFAFRPLVHVFHIQ